MSELDKYFKFRVGQEVKVLNPVATQDRISGVISSRFVEECHGGCTQCSYALHVINTLSFGSPISQLMRIEEVALESIEEEKESQNDQPISAKWRNRALGHK